jgi:hypothetical protein
MGDRHHDYSHSSLCIGGCTLEVSCGDHLV